MHVRLALALASAAALVAVAGSPAAAPVESANGEPFALRVVRSSRMYPEINSRQRPSAASVQASSRACSSPARRHPAPSGPAPRAWRKARSRRGHGTGCASPATGWSTSTLVAHRPKAVLWKAPSGIVKAHPALSECEPWTNVFSHEPSSTTPM